MERLLNFVYTYRAFFTFLFLELFCAWLVIQNNRYQGARYFNSSNRLVARMNETSQSIREYFALDEINKTLAQENSLLRRRLAQHEQAVQLLRLSRPLDSALVDRFDFISAKVVNNTTKYYKNFVTINRGVSSGIEPGMAAISSGCVVGKVKSVSDHFSVLISLLNLDEQVSCSIKRTGHFGTVQWDGTNPAMIDLKYIPRHVSPLVGDSIVTSGYNAVFPAGIYVGRIKEFKLKDEAPFYDIKVELGLDFGKLFFVDIIKSRLKKEKDSLEQLTIGEPK
ncbi:MAG TPA: rod shape-determining protein MreC [Cyclobacteriaceae bacterium]|nr:rod shape-determining protein MreC [Cyclobacteriaceae bacterium]